MKLTFSNEIKMFTERLFAIYLCVKIFQLFVFALLNEELYIVSRRKQSLLNLLSRTEREHCS